MTNEERLAQEERSKELLRFDESMMTLDEQHLRSALYLVQKAIALRERDDYGMPTLHACLRDASIHLEAARGYWTKECEQRSQKLLDEIFASKELQPV